MARHIKSNAAMIKALQDRFSKNGDSIHALDREGEKGQFIISAENGDTIKDWPVGDYYDAAHFDPDEHHHIFGVNRVLKEWCEARGWRLEWENAGCIIAYFEE